MSAINFFVKIVEFCVVYESVLKIKKIGNKIFFNKFDKSTRKVSDEALWLIFFQNARKIKALNIDIILSLLPEV